MQANFSHKMIDCLEAIEARATHGVLSQVATDRMMQAQRRWGPKVVSVKIDELCRRGYIMTLGGYLTEKGRQALAAARAAMVAQ